MEVDGNFGNIMVSMTLRLPHRNDAKNSRNLQPLDILACNSGNRQSLQNLAKSVFGQCSIDVKSAVRFLE